jgi:hypothetical protein
MADVDEIKTAYDRYLAASKEANALTKAAVFDVLVDEGIDRVIVNFDGEGDSGQIESITAYQQDAEVEIPATSLTHHQVQWGSDSIVAATSPVHDAIEGLCYAFLSEEQGGWENNDGAYGDFTFHVSDRRIELDFRARYTDTTSYSYTF